MVPFIARFYFIIFFNHPCLEFWAFIVFHCREKFAHKILILATVPVKPFFFFPRITIALKYESLSDTDEKEDRMTVLPVAHLTATLRSCFSRPALACIIIPEYGSSFCDHLLLLPVCRPPHSRLLQQFPQNKFRPASKRMFQR